MEGTSRAPDTVSGTELDSEEKTKGELTNALIIAESLLRDLDVLTNPPPNEISVDSMAIGDAIQERIVQMLSERQMITVDELIGVDEEDELHAYEPCRGVPDDEDDYIAEEFAPEPPDYVPLWYKEKVVVIAAAHPKWSLKTLQANGASRLKHQETLHRWREDVECGGTQFDKWHTIDRETYERFLEARRNNEQVTTRTLQQWAMNSAFLFLSETFTFNANTRWVERFKRKHKMRQRKIPKWISSKEVATMEEVLSAAKEFRTQTRIVIPDFDLNYVITSCHCQSTPNRSLAVNKASNFYTAQYALTASGKILPFVFLCMQEPSGKFSPIVKRRIKELTVKFKNVIVTCSKSGKLTKELYKEFLKSFILPYVRKNKFLFIIDSQSGQTDQTIYDHLFVDDKKACTCTLKVIPSKCTPISQPYDVYFCRQVKLFIKKLQEAFELSKNKGGKASRKDWIKLHSLLLHQLSAPVFTPMIKYAWYASKLIDEKTSFLDLDQRCFSVQSLKNPCACEALGFIKCAWCSAVLCFGCFYDKYHPEFCASTNTDDSNKCDRER